MNFRIISGALCFHFFVCLFLFLINVFSCFRAQMFATKKQSILVFEAAVDKLSEEYFISAHILTSRLAAMRKRKRCRERERTHVFPSYDPTEIHFKALKCLYFNPIN